MATTKIKLAITIACIVLSLSGIMIVEAATLVQSGWENSNGNDPSDSGQWTVYGQPYVVTSPVHSGLYSCAFSTSADQLCYNQFTPVQALQLSAWVYFDNLPTAAGGQTFVVWIYDGASNCEVATDVINVGGIVYWGCEDNSGISQISNIVATPHTWHQVVLQGFSGNPFKYNAWIDGVQILNMHADSTYSSPFLNYAIVGGWHKGESVTVYVDDVNASSQPFPVFALPEYAFGGLLATIACFAGFVVFRKRKSIPKIGISLRSPARKA